MDGIACARQSGYGHVKTMVQTLPIKSLQSRAKDRILTTLFHFYSPATERVVDKQDY